MKLLIRFTTALLMFCAIAAIAQTMIPITTRDYDNSRSGWNPHETTLTQASILANGLRRITTIPVIGDARGMEAKPLIRPALKMADGTIHDLMILPSMANVVRGVDAHTGVGLWQTTLGMPITSNGQIDMHQINQHFGCVSTGVLDTDTNRLYQVCWVSNDGSGNPASGRYIMYVINVVTGALVTPGIPVQGTDSSMWKQRSSLVMTNIAGVKTIFFAHGSVYETATGFTGGITAFDVATNTVVTTLPMTSGIWMGGQGLVTDAAGYLYAITGNGDFDPSQGWYGESFVKVKYASGKLTVVDQWSPWTDYARAGQAIPAEKVAGDSAPSEAMKPVGGSMSMSMTNATLVATMNAQGQPQVLVYPMASGAWSDEDWGSAGPACIMAINVCIAAGKDGIGYPISMTALGSTTAATVGTAANYAKLAAPCAWMTMSPGPIPCDPPNAQTLNFFPGGDSAHMHMTPVQFYDPVLKSWTIFAWGENQQLHKWAVSPTGALTYVAQSNEFASADVRNRAPGGMPGGFCTRSSNGNDPNSAILVCSIPYGDGNATVTNGRLLVYDPVHLNANGSLKVLWDSQRWGIPYVFNKFMPPTIDGGEIILPNYNGGVDIYR